MAEDDGLEWLSDYVLAFLKSPSWVSPIAQFVDERCIEFDGEDENKLEYTACHNEFKELINSLLAAHLLELSVTREQFEQFCQTGLSTNPALHRVLVEQLLSVDDFLIFKAMMTKRNTALYREAQRRVDAGQLLEDADGPEVDPAVAQLGKDLAARAITPCQDFNDTTIIEDDDFGATGGFGNTAAFVSEEWQLYEDQLFQALDDDTEDQERREEDEMEQAIALSLQMEEERLRELALQEEAVAAAELASAVEAAPAPPAPPPAAEEPAAAEAAPAEAPPAVAPLKAATTLGPLRPVLPRVMRVAPMNSRPGTAAGGLPPPNAGEQDRMRAEAAAILQLNRERAAAPPPAAPTAPAPAEDIPAAPAAPPRAVPTEAERKERAEHLRRQRELLVAKRNKERQRQLTEFQSSSRCNTPAGKVRPARGMDMASGAASAAAGQSLVAELAPSQPGAAGVGDTTAAAQQMRQALTAQLRQTLMRG